MDFPLTSRLFDLINSSPCRIKTIQFKLEGDAMESFEQEGVCEIGFTKKGYLALFLEGHTYFTQGLSSGNFDNLKNASDKDLDQVYMATNALLVTTNEHTTAWRLHQDVVAELWCRRANSGKDSQALLRCEFNFVIALATSRLAKINKSSILWAWIRKLSLLTVFGDADALLAFVGEALRSMEVHFANYSASFTLNWAISIAAMNSDIAPEQCLPQVRLLCRKNLSDTSLWHVMGLMLRGGSQAYAVAHYNQLARNAACFQNVPQYEGNSHTKSLPEEALAELKWLIAVRCQVWTPYFQVLSAVDKTEAAAVLKEVSGEGKFVELAERALSLCQ